MFDESKNNESTDEGQGHAQEKAGPQAGREVERVNQDHRQAIRWIQVEAGKTQGGWWRGPSPS